MTKPLKCLLGFHARPQIISVKDKVYRQWYNRKDYFDLLGVEIIEECPRCHKQTFRYTNEISDTEYAVLIAWRLRNYSTDKIKEMDKIDNLGINNVPLQSRLYE
jgi:hypothetical protein